MARRFTVSIAQRALMLGELRPLGFMPPSAVVRIESERQAFVGYFESLPGVTPLTRAFDEVYLINAIAPELLTLLPNQHGAYRVELLDHFLRPLDITPNRLESGPRGLLVHLQTPIPSVVRLTRIAYERASSRLSVYTSGGSTA